MVGKSNQKVDQLQKRVSQLEWLLKEQSPKNLISHQDPHKALQQ
jgi:hypothetical protein